MSKMHIIGINNEEVAGMYIPDKWYYRNEVVRGTNGESLMVLRWLRGLSYEQEEDMYLVGYMGKKQIMSDLEIAKFEGNIEEYIICDRGGTHFGYKYLDARYPYQRQIGAQDSYYPVSEREKLLELGYEEIV